MNKFLLLTERSKYEILEIMPNYEKLYALANFFQNFADTTRLKILTCLTLCDLCVNDLANVLNLNQTTVSHQLQTLRQQGFVNFKRNGKVLVYYLQKKAVNDVMLTAVQAL